MKNIKKYIVSCKIEMHSLTPEGAIEGAKLSFFHQEPEWFLRQESEWVAEEITSQQPLANNRGSKYETDRD